MSGPSYGVQARLPQSSSPGLTRGPSRAARVHRWSVWVAGSSPAMTTERPVCVRSVRDPLPWANAISQVPPKPAVGHLPHAAHRGGPDCRHRYARQHRDRSTRYQAIGSKPPTHLSTPFQPRVYSPSSARAGTVSTNGRQRVDSREGMGAVPDAWGAVVRGGQGPPSACPSRKLGAARRDASHKIIASRHIASRGPYPPLIPGPPGVSARPLP